MFQTKFRFRECSSCSSRHWWLSCGTCNRMQSVGLMLYTYQTQAGYPCRLWQCGCEVLKSENYRELLAIVVLTLLMNHNPSGVISCTIISQRLLCGTLHVVAQQKTEWYQPRFVFKREACSKSWQRVYRKMYRTRCFEFQVLTGTYFIRFNLLIFLR